MKNIARQHAADHVFNAAHAARGASRLPALQVNFHRCGVSAVIKRIGTGSPGDAVEVARQFGAVGEDKGIVVVAADQVLDIRKVQRAPARCVLQPANIDIPDRQGIQTGQRVGAVVGSRARFGPNDIDIIKAIPCGHDAGFRAHETVHRAQAGQDPAARVGICAVVERIRVCAAVDARARGQCSRVVEDESIRTTAAEQADRARSRNGESIRCGAADDDLGVVPVMDSLIPTPGDRDGGVNVASQAKRHRSEVERVQAFARVLVDRIRTPAISEDVGVVARLTCQGVRARAAGDHVIRRIAAEGIIPCAADEILNQRHRAAHRRRRTSR